MMMVRVHQYAPKICGIGSLVEFQPSKLAKGVRFSYPAPVYCVEKSYFAFQAVDPVFDSRTPLKSFMKMNYLSGVGVVVAQRKRSFLDFFLDNSGCMIMVVADLWKFGAVVRFHSP